MQKLKRLVAGLLIFVPTAAFASYVGKLDLGSKNPEAIALRELNDGMWLVGMQQQAWHLESGGREVFHVSGFWATRLEGQSAAYGPSAGVNVGEAAHAAIDKLELLVPVVRNWGFVVPPFVDKVASWTSFDLYGGYRPVTGADDHHWIYGVGGKVTIPFDKIYAWASGTQASGDGVKGL